MNATSIQPSDPARANQGSDGRRSDQLDRGTVGTVSRVGDIAEGLRNPNKKQREDKYASDPEAKLLRTIECLQGNEWEPVTINRMVSRTGCKRDAVMRRLTRLKKSGWVKELPSGKERLFVAGPKLENLARSLSAALLTRR